MLRLGCAFVLVVAACSDNGSGTGKATLTGVSPAATSAYSKTFSGPDGSGTKVLGWKIVFLDDPIGTGCMQSSDKVAATVAIYTSQTGSAGAIAMLQTGDISIVPNTPPNVIGTEVADMSASGIGNINGDLNITGIDLSGNGKTVIGLEGTLTAAGTNGAGNAVSMSGTFSALTCTP